MTKDDTHQALTSIYNRLSFHPSTWCPHLTPLRKGVLWQFPLVTVSTFAPPESWFQGLPVYPGTFPPPCLLTSPLPLVSLLQWPHWYPLPIFIQDISHWCQWKKHCNLGFCNLEYMIPEAHIFQVANYLFSVNLNVLFPREFKTPSDAISSFACQLDNLPAGVPPRTIVVGPSCWSTRGSQKFHSRIPFARS